MRWETKPPTSSSTSRGNPSRQTRRFAGALWTNPFSVASAVMRWSRRPSPRDQLGRLKRELEKADQAVIDLRRARLRQLSAARRHQADS